MKLDRIDYNGGEIWVEETDPNKAHDSELWFSTGLNQWNNLKHLCHETGDLGEIYKIVAQSITNPSYIDGVPFVEVGLIPSWDKERQIDFSKMMFDLDEKGKVESTTHYAQTIYNRGYKAAQAKQFTEADLRFHATRFAHLCRLKGVVTNNDTINLFDSEYINSLKPKVVSIEIEMEFCPQALPNDRYLPKTYQKDGKTFLKVK